MKSPLPTKLGCCAFSRHAISLLTLTLIQAASPISAAPSYGETQGTNGWRWRYAPVNSTTEFVDYNTFSGNSWSKDTPENWNWGVFHAANRLQPGINADTVAEFTAPSNGTLKIFTRTPARITETYDSRDGVRIKILHNDRQLWPASGWENVAPGREVWVPAQRVNVTQGDTIRFRTNCGSSGVFDQLNWDFDVEYETLPEEGVFSPSQSYGKTQGKDGWQWQNAAAAAGDSAVPTDLNYFRSGCWWRDTSSNWSQGAFLKSNRMQPGSSGDVVTTFTCPFEGEITIQTRAPVRITPGYSSTDGVRIKILKNNSPIWPASGWMPVGPTDQIMVPPIPTRVLAGDTISFKVNANANGVSDDTTWHFTIAYAARFLSGASLQADILAAAASGTNRYVIAPGVYKVPQVSGSPAHLNFTNLSNFEIDGTGVRLLFEGTAPGMRFENCTNVTLRGITTDYLNLAHTQGVITAIAPTAITVRIDDGYPRDLDDPARFPTAPIGSFFDPDTLKLKPGTKDAYGSLVTRVNENTFEIAVPSVDPTVQVGDLMAFRSLCGMATIFFRCATMKLTDVTLHGGSFGLLESYGDGGNLYTNYRVTYGPPPAGATRPRLLSTFADALHSGNMRVGPDLRQCVFTGMGDDGVNIRGMYGMVMEIESPTTVVVGYENLNPIQASDPIRFFERTLTPRGTRTVLTVSGTLANYTPQTPSWYTEFTPTRFYRFTVDSPLSGLASGDWVGNPASSGSGFQITNSVFRNNRARGAVIRAENGSITNCVFDGNSMHGVLIAPELWSDEYGYAAHVTLSNNKFRNIGFYGSGLPAVRIDGEEGIDAGAGHSHITLTGNTFERNFSTDLFIRFGNTFTVENNTFGQRHSAVTGTPGATDPHVMLSHLTTLTLSGNTFSPGRIAVAADPSVSGVTGSPTPAQAFVAETAFSGTQGNLGWHWKNAPIGTNAYADLNLYLDGAWWASTQNNWGSGMIRSTRLQPGTTHDVARVFLAPTSGAATIRTLAPLSVNYPGSDGVQVQILKNNTALWPANGWMSVLPGSPVIAPDLETTLQPGDVLQFRVNILGSGVSDDVTWKPAVYLTTP